MSEQTGRTEEEGGLVSSIVDANAFFGEDGQKGIAALREIINPKTPDGSPMIYDGTDVAIEVRQNPDSKNWVVDASYGEPGLGRFTVRGPGVIVDSDGALTLVNPLRRNDERSDDRVLSGMRVTKGGIQTFVQKITADSPVDDVLRHRLEAAAKAGDTRAESVWRARQAMTMRRQTQPPQRRQQ